MAPSSSKLAHRENQMSLNSQTTNFTNNCFKLNLTYSSLRSLGAPTVIGIGINS